MLKQQELKLVRFFEGTPLLWHPFDGLHPNSNDSEFLFLGQADQKADGQEAGGQSQVADSKTCLPVKRADTERSLYFFD